MQNFIIAELLKIAVSAGQEIMAVYSTDFSIEHKSDNSPITLADRRANEVIMKGLSAVSDFPVLSEEGIHQNWDVRKNWFSLFLVDPLDGTKEFVNRNGEFTVNIALIENNRPVLGVIYAPVTKDLYYGSSEKGAYKITGADSVSAAVSDRAVKIHVRKPEEGKLTVLKSRSHPSSETQAYISELSEKFRIDTVCAGSSLKLCLIAEGRADLYPRLSAGTWEWDIAAGQAILEAAGGYVIKVSDRRPLMYNREDLRNPGFIAGGREW